MATELTKRAVDALRAGPSDAFIWDGTINGFGIKVTPTGRKVFLLSYRFPRGRAGKSRRYTIGTYGDITVDQARRIAEAKRGDIARGIDPMTTLEAERREAEAKRKVPKRSVEHVARDFIERYAKKNNRSWAETERILMRYVVPVWGRRQIAEITRADVNELLDEIEDKSGAPMATAVLAQVRKMFNWCATRDDRFNSPIVRGMARISPKKMKRDRVLSDDEIRIMWRALDACAPPYRQLVRFLLLTAQRREEVAQARHDEFKGGVWTIPPDRYKTGIPNAVPLTKAAQNEIDDLGLLRDLGPFVFTTTGNKPFSGFSKAKHRLDNEMERLMREAAGSRPKGGRRLLEPWRLHDLRRTAKTLMQRAGVRPDISERVLGHVIPGVEGTYDRHHYLPEKHHALEALAASVGRIVSDQAIPQVIPFRPSIPRPT